MNAISKSALSILIVGAALCHAHAIALNPSPPATRSLPNLARCPNAVVLHDHLILPSSESDNVVTMTHYSCGNTSSIAEVDLRTLARPVTEEDPRPVVSAPLHHVPRQFQNCAGGASDQQCECATLCGPLPFCNLGPAPAQSDCNVISDALSTVAGSFLVPSGQATGFSFGSCEAVFANEASTTLEYCFENMASLTAATFTNCVTIAHGGVGGCIADDFRWFFELHITGTPIQIP